MFPLLTGSLKQDIKRKCLWKEHEKPTFIKTPAYVAPIATESDYSCENKTETHWLTKNVSGELATQRMSSRYYN